MSAVGNMSLALARLLHRTHPWGITFIALATACNAPTCTREPPASVLDAAVAPTLAPTPPANPLAGTPCETLANAGPPHPRGPLPEDPKLAAFTTQVESVADEYLALEALNVGQMESLGWRGPDEATRACARVLWDRLREQLPVQSELRLRAQAMTQALFEWKDGGTQAPATRDVLPGAKPPGPVVRAWSLTGRDADSQVCDSVAGFLKPFPPNPRLRRALLLHFSPCVIDFSSFDGPLDVTEPLMRATAAALPDRIALTYALRLAKAKTEPQLEASIFIADVPPFHRIPLDLGPTGNALRVIRDLVAKDDAQRLALLAIAKQRAEAQAPAQRRARWVALVAYLEAGVPDPGTPPEAGLARALSADMASARWALGLIPNELHESVPRPYPHVRDRALTAALAARSEALETDEDVVLALDAVSRAAPGTGAPLLVRAAGSKLSGVRDAALAAIKRQVEQLPDPRGAHAVFAPHIDGLRMGLASQTCTSDEALQTLADLGDLKLDVEVAACLLSHPERVDRDTLPALRRVCRRREFGWSQTAQVLDHMPVTTELGEVVRGVALLCRTGQGW